MDERIYSLFRNEMNFQARPSLDGMPQEVLAKGQRARRARRARAASAVLMAAGGLAGFAVAVPTISGGHSVATGPGAVTKSGSPHRPATAGSHVRPHGQTAPAGGEDMPPGVELLATTNPADYIPQPPGPKASTTPAAVLDELLKLLPPGATSNYALWNYKQTPQQAFDRGAQTYFDGASGVGMIRIHLFKGSLDTSGCASGVVNGVKLTCRTLAGGAPAVISRNPGNCIESLSVAVDHGNGTVVWIDVSTCLAWNGNSNPSAKEAITASAALRIAANPVWGSDQMDAALVRDAASQFPGVPVQS